VVNWIPEKWPIRACFTSLRQMYSPRVEWD
jgi:hypothetical protein